MAQPDVSSPESPRSVGWLNGALKAWIARLGSVWIEGELTEWNVRQRAVYATLKDLGENTTLSLQIWLSGGLDIGGFKKGDHVLAHVKPDFWYARGSLSLNVLEIRHVGVGAEWERLLRLRAQLAQEGLSAAARKRPLPFIPQHIGLITGERSDAEQDVLKNARERWPDVRFRTHYVKVQGASAVTEVIAAIRALDADPEIDVIIIARGGGSFHDVILPFSDESLVRTAAAATTPIVSAIGHEQDNPLLDDVADLRASTPTDAAKRVVPDIATERAALTQARARLLSRITSLVATETDRIAAIRSRPALSSPRVMIDTRVEDLARWIQRGSDLVDRRIEATSSELGSLRAGLRALSPLATLERGYAIARTSDGRVLRSASDTEAGDRIRVRLADGELATRVEQRSRVD